MPATAQTHSKPSGTLFTYIPLARTSTKAEPSGRNKEVYSAHQQDVVRNGEDVEKKNRG